MKAKYDLKAESYHDKQYQTVREKKLAAFKDGDIQVLCTTSVFGVNIEKSNIGAIIHYSLPQDLESYISVSIEYNCDLRF